MGWNQSYLGEFKNNPQIKGLIYVIVKDSIVCFEEVLRNE